jgi:predicted DNA-binding transcriptional regulator AlpA
MTVQLVQIEVSDLERMLRAIVREELTSKDEPLKMLTVSQIAKHLQVSKQSINNWTGRTLYPMPVHYAGGEPRFYLHEVDQWTLEEAARKRV